MPKTTDAAETTPEPELPQEPTEPVVTEPTPRPVQGPDRKGGPFNWMNPKRNANASLDLKPGPDGRITKQMQWDARNAARGLS